MKAVLLFKITLQTIGISFLPWAPRQDSPDRTERILSMERSAPIMIVDRTEMIQSVFIIIDLRLRNIECNNHLCIY